MGGYQSLRCFRERSSRWTSLELEEEHVRETVVRYGYTRVCTTPDYTFVQIYHNLQRYLWE